MAKRPQVKTSTHLDKRQINLLLIASMVVFRKDGPEAAKRLFWLGFEGEIMFQPAIDEGQVHMIVECSPSRADAVRKVVEQAGATALPVDLTGEEK